MIRYANVAGQLMEPNTGLKGLCPGCGNAVIAKCGTVKIHHWAHQRRIDCDPWWEPMTQWHLDWQNKFPKAWREVIFRDQQTGEFHRADVHTPKETTIEFQHSPLSLQELKSRNDFYKKIIWVVNAQRFKEQFEFTNATPNPASPLLADYNFSVDSDGLSKYVMFFLKAEGRDPRQLGRIFSLRDKELKLAAEEFKKTDKTYWLFNWKYKHKTWLNSEAPVFLDFGDDCLYWIKKREQWPNALVYLKVIKKEEFLNKYATEVRATNER